MKPITFVYDIYKRFPLLLTGNILLLAMVNLIGVASIVTIVPIVDYFINPELKNVSALTLRVVKLLQSLGIPVTLGSLLSTFLTFQVLKNCFFILARYSLLRTNYAVARDLTVGAFRDFFGARWLFFSGNKQGTLLNTLTAEIAVVGNGFSTAGVLFASLVQLIFYLSVPFYISWQVTSIATVGGLILALPFLLLGRLNYRLGRQNTATGNEMTHIIQESLGSAKVILGFGNQHKSVENLADAFDAHQRAGVKSQTLNLATPLMYEPLGLLVVVICLFAAQRFSVSLSEMAALLWALRQSVPSIGGLAAHRNLLSNFLPSYEQVRNLRERAVALRHPSGGRPFTGFEREIAVEGLSFAYPGQEPALMDINLRIPKGRMVAFVGESGAGKSTLIDMILGFYEPVTGQITFDGVPLDAFDVNSYRQRIGYVPQDSILFNMTIRENLRWAREDATDEDMARACRQANADEFIRGFPDGYDTLVGDRGVRLSGGERQRIALARAVLRNPELLILDEATSSLDTQSERLIQSAIEAIAKKTTIIVIAHRLSTIVNADHVCVLHRGRLVEEGTYDSLVNVNGYFGRMTQLQILGKTG